MARRVDDDIRVVLKAALEGLFEFGDLIASFTTTVIGSVTVTALEVPSFHIRLSSVIVNTTTISNVGQVAESSIHSS